jgi:hypothetical protein
MDIGSVPVEDIGRFIAEATLSGVTALRGGNGGGEGVAGVKWVVMGVAGVTASFGVSGGIRTGMPFDLIGVTFPARAGVLILGERRGKGGGTACSAYGAAFLVGSGGGSA